MDILEAIANFLRIPKSENANLAPEGICPNCWGRQDYDDHFRELQSDMQVDVNNHQAHYAFIQKFVVNKIEGIHLKKEDSKIVCITCNEVHE